MFTHYRNSCFMANSESPSNFENLINQKKYEVRLLSPHPNTVIRLCGDQVDVQYVIPKTPFIDKLDE